MINAKAENILMIAERYHPRCRRYDIYTRYRNQLIEVCRDNKELEDYTKKLAKVIGI